MQDRASRCPELQIHFWTRTEPKNGLRQEGETGPIGSSAGGGWTTPWSLCPYLALPEIGQHRPSEGVFFFRDLPELDLEEKKATAPIDAALICESAETHRGRLRARAGRRSGDVAAGDGSAQAFQDSFELGLAVLKREAEGKFR